MTQYYVGLDVSLNQTAVCITDQNGTILHERMVQTEPEDIDTYLRSTGFFYERIGLEAGNLSIWLYKALFVAGYPVVVIETKQAAAVIKVQRAKTDRNDARAIANLMRTSWYTAVHVKSDESQELRILLSNRNLLIRKRKDIENQIRGTLKIFGIKLGIVSTQKFKENVLKVIHGKVPMESWIAGLLRVRDVIIKEAGDLHKDVLRYVKHDEICQLLMTAPGVGPITALSYKTTIDNPLRFTRPRDVPAHLGLTPKKYASGEVDRDGGITKCGDKMLRAHLYEAAMTILRRRMARTPLKAWGNGIAKKNGKKKAAIAVSRRLSIILHRMWMDGTPFDPDFGTQQQTEKAA